MFKRQTQSRRKVMSLLITRTFRYTTLCEHIEHCTARIDYNQDFIYIYIFYSGKCYFFFNLVSSRVSGLLIAAATFICYLLNLSQLLVHWEKESVVFLRYYEAGFHYVFPVPMETNFDGGKYDANMVYRMHSYLNFRLESF